MARRRIVTGIENVRKVFDRVSAESQVEITHALNKGGEEIAERARQLVPVRTGELRGAIEVRLGARTNPTKADPEAQGAPNSAVVRVGVFADRDGSPGWYARFVEFGTRGSVKGERAGVSASDKKQHKTLGRIFRRTHSGTRARPFLFPAYFSIRNRVIGRVKRAVRAAAKAAARG